MRSLSRWYDQPQYTDYYSMHSISKECIHTYYFVQSYLRDPTVKWVVSVSGLACLSPTKMYNQSTTPSRQTSIHVFLYIYIIIIILIMYWQQIVFRLIFMLRSHLCILQYILAFVDILKRQFLDIFCLVSKVKLKEVIDWRFVLGSSP